MKSIISKVFSSIVGKRSLSSFQTLKIEEADANKILGGFREYKPPIYELEAVNDQDIKTKELFNQT
ncbi:hypothetical protein [Sphingobacterium sp.]|uniref:hypothetical protein n=1 Tax=Sphingobacterium sp. TaxID=341027 RepID=UPI0028A25DD9|nr:hypothetical protein [Sphingobacterium sp.]